MRQKIGCFAPKHRMFCIKISDVSRKPCAWFYKTMGVVLLDHARGFMRPRPWFSCKKHKAAAQGPIPAGITKELQTRCIRFSKAQEALSHPIAAAHNGDSVRKNVGNQLNKGTRSATVGLRCGVRVECRYGKNIKFVLNNRKLRLIISRYIPVHRAI